jgi:hypothetical protein
MSVLEELTEVQQAAVQQLIEDAVKADRESREKEPEIKLSSYKEGEVAEVYKDGLWVTALIRQVDLNQKLIYTDTDRGPKTVASLKGIRKLSA